jgi:hypothetical protein
VSWLKREKLSIHTDRMNPKGRKSPKTSILAVVGAGVLYWAMLHFKVLAATVTASWSYDYGPLPACSDARPTDCIDHFEVKDITRQDDPTSIQTVNNPTPAFGKIDGITTKFQYGPPFGLITLSVVAVKRERDGSFTTSNPFAAMATVTIRPRARTSVVLF